MILPLAPLLYTTPFQDRGRSKKAQSRTSDMHTLEESDRTTVPTNQSNKEGSAEVGEGRVRTKENIAQSNTIPTQSGERVAKGLRGVREQQRQGSRNGSPPCSNTYGTRCPRRVR